MFQISSKRIAVAVAGAALSLSVFAQVSLAAELEAAALPNTSSAVPAIQPQSLPSPQVGQSFTAPYTVGHSSDGWMLDYGGPSLYFESSVE